MVVHRLLSCSMQAEWLCGRWDLSSPTRDRTRVLCSARGILNCWTTREVPVWTFEEAYSTLLFGKHSLRMSGLCCVPASGYFHTQLALSRGSHQNLSCAFTVCQGLTGLWGWHESEVARSCPTLCDPGDCSLPGSSVHGIFQARVLEWVAISFSRGSSQPRD